MSQKVIVVDAFTTTPFAGNPAAVVLLSAPADEEWMRLVAREMNLAETAFLHPEADGWRLRWLTPTVEVDLCGHATLASAHVLWEDGHLSHNMPARFHTRSGLLTATCEHPQIILDFPAKRAEASDPPEALCRALGITTPRWIGRNQFDYFVELADEAAVRALMPDHAILASLPVRGVIVTARADAGAPHDFVSRFFAPGSGIAEDPVTGSAHCALAPYWSARLGRTELVGYQASLRGGTVQVQVRGDRVLLGGQAVTMMRGMLMR
ncbi:MAG: PhzF family phenazine biosynthesis protein [Gemmatimonadales bacterium]